MIPFVSSCHALFFTPQVIKPIMSGSNVLSIVGLMRLRHKTLHFSIRTFATNKNPLGYIPHQFSTEEAAKKFVQANRERWFAPLKTETVEGIVPFKKSPLIKVFIPIYGIKAEVSKTHYKGQWGVERIRTYYDSSSKQTKIETYIEWYNTSGTIGSQSYDPQEKDMTIYGGKKWYSKLVEEALEGFNVKEHLQPFDRKQIDTETEVDIFNKPIGYARQVAAERIKPYERYRAEQDIMQRKNTSWARIDSNGLDIVYDSFKLESAMYPAYFLKYEGCPPQIMPALNDHPKIVGASPLSVSKVMGITTVATTILSVFFPQISISLRLGTIIASSFTSGFFAKFKLSMQESYQQYIVRDEAHSSENIAETIGDKGRRIATEGEKNEEVYDSSVDKNKREFCEENSKLNVDPAFFNLLGLARDKKITEEMVRAAFAKKIQLVHPDHNHNDLAVSSFKTRELIKARQGLLEALRERGEKGFPNGKRNFSTMKPTALVKEPPRSTMDPRARVLINAVLKEHDYKKALRLVEEEEIHPDSHDEGENTLLTEAVKKGTYADVKFIIEELGASVDTSCDCPAHRTALHYAVAKGRYDIVKLLLAKKANPNLITSWGETALDIAIANEHEEIKKLIIEHRGIQNKGVGKESLMRRISGYRSHERTILLKIEDQDSKKVIEKKNDVIHLPPKK